MRIRLSGFLAVALLPLFGPPLTAADPPAPKPMVTKVFGVADLVVPFPEEVAARLLPCPPRADGPKKLTVAESGEKLMRFVTGMVRPYSWADAGGPGSAEFFDIGSSLVVRNSPEVVREVSDVLEALRRLQERQLSTQVHVLTVPAGFCESLGLKRDASQPLTEREMRMLLGAAQGHARANVMQFPKVTTLDGQTATVRVGDQKVYAIGIEARMVEGKVEFAPTTRTVDLGHTLRLCGTVSADQKSVKLQVNLTHAREVGAPVRVPVSGFATPVVEGGYSGGPVAYSRMLELPCVKTERVQKTAVVPTGGTVVLGVWTEPDAAFGPPTLGKIPYLNRLYKNVSVAECEVLVLATARVLPCDAIACEPQPMKPVALAAPACASEVCRMRNVAAADAAAAVNKHLAKQAPGVVVVAEPVSNAVLVSGEQALVRQVGRDLAAMDVAPRQVLIQALVMEVPADWLADIGLKQEEGKPLVLTEREVAMFNAAVRTQKEKAGIDILSRPQMQVADNQTGFAQVGQGVPYVARTDAADDAGKAKVEYFPVGVGMRVTPRINPDGTLLLRVEHQHSAVSPTPVDLGNGVKAPAFNVHSLQTTARVGDGQTLVVSGGVSKTVNKVDGEIRRQTLILLTPHVVRSEPVKPAAHAAPAPAGMSESPVVLPPPAPRR